MELKREVRRRALEQMAGISRSFIDEGSAKVIENLKSVPEFATARGVFSCLSYRQEVDTWPLVEELAADPDREVYIPRADRGDPLLHVHRYPCRLETLKIGLKQPSRNDVEVPVDEIPSRIEVALVLGVLYDRNQGYRLGYGGGYFDRFLATYPVCSIGLTFERQMADSLPTDAHDVALNIIVTEEQVYRFGDA